MTEPARRRAELALLHALFDLTPAQRDLRLAEVEHADRELADAVRRMLATSDTVAANQAQMRPAAAEVAAGCVLGGRFRLLRPLGRGGMGEVYLARRDDGIDQHVAIKILHGEGLAVTRERAHREQQILARLTHPNIAGLIDAGLTDAGRPWFAMDYVDGERLLEWCDHRTLTLPARVRLFVQIARALQFAHRNLVLHRDVKPSNILVDHDGIPVLLDFGIAKVIDAQAPAHETRTLALTPAYAAPEQLRGEPATTASEVYQLGIVLYELTSGISAREARAHAQADATTVVVPAPHQAFAACWLRDRAQAERLVRLRASSPQKLRRDLKGDLGRIIAKASAPLPAERYDTAQAFADDLERWLAGNPVSAHRGSWRYRVGKLVRRHKAASALTAVLALGLLAVSALALDRAQREHEQRVEAERQRERSDALVDFFRSLFRQADPDLAGASQIGADQLLERADVALDARNDVDPSVRAALLSEIAAAFYNLGMPRNGLAAAEQAVTLSTPRRADNPKDYLRSVDVASSIYASIGRERDAVDLITQALPTASQVRDDQLDWQAKLMSRRSRSRFALGQVREAVADMQAVVETLRRRGALDGDDGVEARISLAKFLGSQGDYRSAVDALREIVEHAAGSTSRSTRLAARSNLGMNLLGAGEYRQAAAVLEPALAESGSLYGPESYPAIVLHYLLLRSHLALGEPERARVFLDHLQKVRPASVAQFARAKEYIASAGIRYQLATGRFGDAASQAQQALDASEADADTGELHRLLGEAQLQQGDPRRALATFARASEKDTALNNPLRIASIEDGIGRAHLALGELDEAIAHLSRAAEPFRRLQGTDTPDALRVAVHLLWAQALATRDPDLLECLDAQRAALVGALGGEDRLQIWQFDRLRDRLAHQLGRPGIDPDRLARAERGLLRVSGTGKVPDHRGVGTF
ncbi:protein kinase domain-containing protein [Dokdonella ginsengisoli]|uniref:Protein kinase n=1 Tax=Dokdonella ginsengisoli TaxID=363846 RepID=A0ABV9QR58_9GAMM